MTDWQPIETAPKDGTEILLWSPKTKWNPAGAFVGNWYKDGVHSRWCIANVSGWEWECDLDCENPTRWAPLSEPST